MIMVVVLCMLAAAPAAAASARDSCFFYIQLIGFGFITSLKTKASIF